MTDQLNELNELNELLNEVKQEYKSLLNMFDNAYSDDNEETKGELANLEFLCGLFTEDSLELSSKLDEKGSKLISSYINSINKELSCLRSYVVED